MKTIVMMMLVTLTATVSFAKTPCNSMNMDVEKYKIAHTGLGQNEMNLLIQATELAKYSQIIACTVGKQSLSQDEVQFASKQVRILAFEKISALNGDIARARYELTKSDISLENRRLTEAYIQSLQEEIAEQEAALNGNIRSFVKAGR